MIGSINLYWLPAIISAVVDCPINVTVAIDPERDKVKISISNHSDLDVLVKKDHLPFKGGIGTFYSFQASGMEADPEMLSIPSHFGIDDEILIPANQASSFDVGISNLFNRLKILPDGVFFWYWEYETGEVRCSKNGVVRLRAVESGNR